MRLKLIYESFLDLVSREDLIEKIRTEVIDAYKQILEDYPMINDNHEVEQEMKNALSKMRENAIDLKRTDPFIFAYEEFARIIRQGTAEQDREEAL